MIPVNLFLELSLPLLNYLRVLIMQLAIFEVNEHKLNKFISRFQTAFFFKSLFLGLYFLLEFFDFFTWNIVMKISVGLRNVLD